MNRTAAPLAVVAVVALAAAAHAQTSAGLATQPWLPREDPARVETTTGGLWQSTESDGTGEDVDIFEARTVGRVRLPGDVRMPPAIGWRYETIRIDTDDTALPSRLEEFVAAVGTPVGQWDGWGLGVTAGVGFSGDQAFADEDAWYGVASFSARKKVGERSSWMVVVDYNGNRTFLPDIPIPAIAYQNAENLKFRYVIGIPFSSVYWEPDDHWYLDASYFPVFRGQAEIGYRINDAWTIAANYTSDTRAYHLDGDDENRRLFFEQQRLSIGAKWKPDRDLELGLAAGYAFGQEFSRGWDARDLDTVRELESAPFLSFALNWRF